MPKIYVVMGNTGEYSDFQQWPVDAWMSEEKAKARVIELEHLLRVHRLARGDYDRKNSTKGRDAVRALPNGDVQLEVDYTGAGYEVMECELKDLR